MPDTPSTKQPVMVRLPPQLDAAVRRIADSEQESRSSVIRDLIRSGLRVRDRAERRSAQSTAA
jgi:metal-responsive CopG/Arc/MetJ family transcriptional regulator